MRITISGRVHLVEVVYEEEYAFPSDEPIEEPRQLKKMNGFSKEEPDFVTYMDPEFAEIGFMGALLTLQYHPQMKSLYVQTHYWAPRRLTNDEVKQLLDETAGQWSDGLGENGIQIEHDGQSYFLLGTSLIDVDDGGFYATQENDEVDIPNAPLVAIHSRKGNAEELQKLLEEGEDPNQKFQEWGSLNRAVSGGHVECVELLLKYGADPNGIKRDDNLSSGSPLIACALMHDESGQKSLTIAKMLIEKGADPSVTQGDNWTAADYAENRGKISLWAYLKSLTQHK